MTTVRSPNNANLSTIVNRNDDKGRRVRGVRVAVLVAVLVVALVAGGCSGDDGGGGADVQDVLATVADEVIVPSYEALSVILDALDNSLAVLCTTPSATGLEAARTAWRDAEVAWQSSRAGGVGPAVDRRLMADVGFRARPDDVEALVAGVAPLEVDQLQLAGAAVRGLGAIEVALFAPSAAALTTADGARRCAYARAAAQLAGRAARTVLEDWTIGPRYRATFVDGMDGDPQSSVEALVNEVTFRLQQLDDQGLRPIALARTPDDLPANRREGPAAFGIGSLRGVLGGVAAVVQGPVDDGLAALVRARSADTADRLVALTADALEALSALPDSIAGALADRPALEAAAEAVAALKVLVSTEVASRLGVTIGFSDADGDS